MKIRKIIVSLILAVCMLLPFVACNESVPVTDISLDKATLTLNVGEEETLTYTVFPQGADASHATWLSSDPSIATVNNGLVKGVKEGTTVVRVTVGEKFSDCSVTVIDPANAPVPVTGISLDQARLSLEAGGTATLVATLEPENATDKTVAWSSSNTATAMVDQNGVVTAVAAGTAVITAKANNYSATCVVTVTGGAAASAGLYVKKVSSLEGREDDFIMGMDSSELLSVEAAREESGLTFKDFNGEDADVLQVLKDNGITDIRIRVWNDPTDSAKKSYGGGNCDVANAVALSKRCEAVGLGVIIDFHYSDFWADPGKQKAPKAWASMGIADKVDALGEFTKAALTQIKATGVKITMVQVGNETTGGMAGETDWANISKLMNAGAKAVRDVTGTVAEGGAKVAVHFTNAGSGDYLGKARTLDTNKVDYDVFGSSWYPYYTSAGSLSNLINQFKSVHQEFGKEVMVLETGYAWTNDDFDGLGNTQLETTTQPVTEQGMSNAVLEVIEKIADLGDWGLGVAYWGGTWVAASEDTTWQVNRPLCEKYGCGWASDAAGSYDDGAKNGGGGTMVDNNAFFRSDGTPLEALRVFKYAFTGHNVNIAADYLYDQEIYYTVNEGPIELPTTVDIVLNNGSRQTVTAIWSVEESELDQYITKAEMYTVEGTTIVGGTCYCHIWVMNVNLLSEGSFEGLRAYGNSTVKMVQTDLGDWQLTHGASEKGDLQLFVSNDEGNARMGRYSFHFWDSGKVDFELFQTLPASALQNYGKGKYGCSFDFQGADGANIQIYSYIKITYNDGTEQKLVKGSNAEMNGWKNWSRTSVTGCEIDPAKVTSVTVGIHVYAEVSGQGPWGNIDNCQFYYEGD